MQSDMPDAENTLRPHHVLILYNYIVKGEDAEQLLRSQINDFENYPQYEDQAMREHIEGGVPLHYSDEFVDRLVGFFGSLAADPEARVRVVDGPDSLCSLGCNRYSDLYCNLPGSEQSKKGLRNRLGLEVGDVFTMSYLLDV